MINKNCSFRERERERERESERERERERERDAEREREREMLYLFNYSHDAFISSTVNSTSIEIFISPDCLWNSIGIGNHANM